eukprot:COSAG01_NODE_67570_length_266_cov_1.556886_1_plen_30_part_01
MIESPTTWARAAAMASYQVQLASGATQPAD